MAYRFEAKNGGINLVNADNFSAFTIHLITLEASEHNLRGLVRDGRFARFNRNLPVRSSHNAENLAATVTISGPLPRIAQQFTDRVEWISSELNGEWSLRFKSRREAWASMGEIELGTICFLFEDHKDYVAFKLRWG